MGNGQSVRNHASAIIFRQYGRCARARASTEFCQTLIVFLSLPLYTYTHTFSLPRRARRGVYINDACKIQIRPKKRGGDSAGRSTQRSVSRPSSHLSRSLISFFSLFFSLFFANTGALITGCGPTATITCLAVSGSKTVSPEGLVRRRIVWIFFSLLLLNKCILYTACIQGVHVDTRYLKPALCPRLSYTHKFLGLHRRFSTSCIRENYAIAFANRNCDYRESIRHTPRATADANCATHALILRSANGNEQLTVSACFFFFVILK